MKTEHTELPWYLDKNSLLSAAAPVIVSDTCWKGRKREIARVLYHDGSEDPEVIANAEFIVKACNSHEDLLEALHVALEFAVAVSCTDYPASDEIEIFKKVIAEVERKV